MTLKLTQLEGTQNENDHVENLNSISNLFSGVTFTHAADTSKAETQNKFEYVQKQQGEWVSYNHNGVTFNGTCQPNENGKLQFKALLLNTVLT